MSRELKGMTHALVLVPSKPDSEASGIRASVSLCWGPGDDTAITNINYVRGTDGPLWTVPHVDVVEDGRHVKSPVFRGELLESLCQTAARALEQVKTHCGAPHWGARYRVFGTSDGTTKVEEVS
jgi:hypothetical protein